MKISDFQKIQIEAAGKFLLVPENQLPQLIEAHNLLNMLGISSGQKIDLSFVLKFYCLKHSLTIAELAEKANMDNKHIWRIQKGMVQHLQEESIKKLVAVFGDSFRLAVLGTEN